LLHAVLQPDFVDALLLPIGEQTHAVGCGHDFVKVILHFREGKILIDILLNLKSRLDVERNFCNDAESGEADDSAGKNIRIVFAGKLDDIARSVDDVESGDRGSEFAVLNAGP